MAEIFFCTNLNFGTIETDLLMVNLHSLKKFVVTGFQKPAIVSDSFRLCNGYVTHCHLFFVHS